MSLPNVEKLYADAKGRTTAIGLDVDTLYEQLLRQMKDADASVRYAGVVPSVALSAALRVPAWSGNASASTCMR